MPNPATLSRTFPPFYRLVWSSGTRPISLLCLKNCALSNSCHHPLNFCHKVVPWLFSSSIDGLRALDFDRSPILAASGGGGLGGVGASGDGGCGGSGEGGYNAGGGGDGWSFLSWYLKLLARYPILTKAITSALLNLLGDLICQLAIDKVPSLDVKRSFLFTFLGLTLVGPTLHFWYLYLSKLVTLPGASGAFSRLLLDQFLFSPIFLGVFLATLTTLEGRPSEVLAKLKQDWFSAVMANWQLWIPFQFLNFRFVPQQFQVLAANVIALAWNVILSFQAHKEVLTK